MTRRPSHLSFVLVTPAPLLFLLPCRSSNGHKVTSLGTQSVPRTEDPLPGASYHLTLHSVTVGFPDLFVVVLEGSEDLFSLYQSPDPRRHPCSVPVFLTRFYGPTPVLWCR